VNYIKLLEDNIVRVGGQVATEEMIADGWFEYDGPIPQGQNFKLINGVLQEYVPEIPVLTQIQIYKDYLTSTDHKMYNDYEPKEGEDINTIKSQRKIARDYIRQNTVIYPSANN